MIALIAAFAGGLIASGKKCISHKVLCGLVSFAAGALLAVTVEHIIPETYEMLGGYAATITIVAGTLVFAAIGKYVYYLCPACAASATEHDNGYLRLGILMMVAMGIHSTVDGLAISAGSHAAEAGSASLGGLLILFAVSYHKIPEGMALVSVARLAGYNRSRALITTILIEMTTAIGAFIGIYFLRGVNEMWLGLTLGIVAGSFLYTVGFALLKEMYAHEKGSIILYVILGFLSIIGLSMVLSYTGILNYMH
ncbi:MAG: ZIP family metal transporter [Armatimonadota bacterium]